MKKHVYPRIRVTPRALLLSKVVPATVLLSVVLLSPVRAQIVSNLTETNTGTFGVQFSDTLKQWPAGSFTTDSSASAFSLESVTLRMETANNTSGNFFAALYSNSSTQPGSLLETLSGTSNPATAGNHAFTSGGTQLLSNTTYWIVAGVSSGLGDYGWDFTDSQSQTGLWSIGNATYLSTDGGSSWSTGAGGSNVRPVMFSVSASAVPEPETYALFASLGAMAVVIWQRRLRPRRAAVES